MFRFFVVSVLLAFLTSSVFAQGMCGGMGGWEHWGHEESRMGGQFGIPKTASNDFPDKQSHGAKLVQQYCSKCHNAPVPGMHSASEWPATLERMKFRMQMMSRMDMWRNVPAPSAEEFGIIESYLEKYALKTIDAASIKDLTSPAAQLFQKTCSQCHALPTPLAHSGAEWSKVVERMQQHIKETGKSVPSDKDFAEIISYLSQYAR